MGNTVDACIRGTVGACIRGALWGAYCQPALVDTVGVEDILA